MIFSSKGNTDKNKSDVRFQYLVNYIIHTRYINDNRDTALNNFMISFSM